MNPDPVQAQVGDRITDVVGITVGHHHRIDDDATLAGENPGAGWATGATVVRIADPRSTVAVDVRGGGPGTRETDLLDPSNTVTTAHALLLTGGSAYGLAAADGVMAELEQAGVGIPMNLHGNVVPIVPAAVIFDLPVGAWDRRPDSDFGRAATAAADIDFTLGSVGAGAGARAGSLKGGVGTASVCIADGPAAGITVGALVVANPAGSVIDPLTGLPWGLVGIDRDRNRLSVPTTQEIAAFADREDKQILNTTIGVVATDAAFPAASVRRIAASAHDGLARAIRPVHTPLDGDTLFAVATGARTPDEQAPTPPIPPGMTTDLAVLTEVCRHGADVTQRAVVSAIIAATSVAGVPAYNTVMPSAFR